MDNIGSYPKIVSILDEKIRDIFGKEVIITEKIDGSQFGWGSVNEQLYYRSKNVVLSDQENPEGLFGEAIGTISKFDKPEKLDVFRWKRDFVLYAEYLKKPKHNILSYDRIPLNHLVLFGGMRNSIQGNKYLNRSTLEAFAKLLKVDIVPILYQGILKNIEMLDKLLETESYLGGSKIEGLVIECRDYVPERMPWMPFALAKYVSEKFKEKHQTNLKSEKKDLDKILELCYKSIARYEKGVQHLRENGMLENSVTDIGAIIKEVRKDFIEEEGAEVKQMIAEFYINKHMKRLLKTITCEIPDWYKNKLKEEINAQS